MVLSSWFLVPGSWFLVLGLSWLPVETPCMATLQEACFEIKMII